MHHLIATSPKRVVDRLVLNLSPSSSTTTSPFSSSSSAAGSNIRTALLYGPMIYGLGVGPGNTRSIQLPTLAASTLHRGYAPYVGQGLNAWSHVHVSDVSALAVKLVHASMGEEDDGLWNKEGVYFPEADKVVSRHVLSPHASVYTCIYMYIYACVRACVSEANSIDLQNPRRKTRRGSNVAKPGPRRIDEKHHARCRGQTHPARLGAPRHQCADAGRPSPFAPGLETTRPKPRRRD